MRRKLVAGNWKMNGTYQQNAALLECIKSGVSGLASEVVVCPPYPYLGQAQSILEGSSVGLAAQSVSEYPVGAFTGEISAYMLREFGCRYVLVGHSERRALFGETDLVVAAKFGMALKAGLSPVLCVGETLAEREAGKTFAVVARQLSSVLTEFGASAMAGALVAYEPVWAIGSGLSASLSKLRRCTQLYVPRFQVWIWLRVNVFGFFTAVASSRRMPRSYLDSPILMVG